MAVAAMRAPLPPANAPGGAFGSSPATPMPIPVSSPSPAPSSSVIPTDLGPLHGGDGQSDLELFQDATRLLNAQREEIETLRRRVLRMDASDQSEIKSCRRQMQKDREERIQQIGAFSIEMETRSLRKIDVLHHEVEGFGQDHVKEDDARQQHQLEKVAQDFINLYATFDEVTNAYQGVMENFVAESPDRLRHPEGHPELIELIPEDED